MNLRKKDRETEERLKNLEVKVSLIEDRKNEDIIIESYIREKYSLSNEIAIHRKKLMGILSNEEWDEYTSYVLECIEKAREQDR